MHHAGVQRTHRLHSAHLVTTARLIFVKTILSLFCITETKEGEKTSPNHVFHQKYFKSFFFRAPVTTEHAAHRLCKGQRGTLEKKIIYQRTTLCVPTALNVRICSVQQQHNM